MLRKLCKLTLLPALLALAAGSEATLAQGQPASTLATNAPAASPEVAIWAATAKYVYEDDPKLRKIQPALLSTIKSNSIKAFSLSIDDAVALEKKQLNGQKDLLKFQELFKTVRAQLPTPNDPVALAKAIVAKLDDNAERMADPARAQQLTLLTQQLTQLAAANSGVAPPVAATPELAADNPMDQVGAAPAAATVPLVTATASLGPVAAPPANQWLWLSLALSALSIGGVLLLWNKLGNTRRELERIKGNWENSSAKSTDGKSIQAADLAKAIEREVGRQLSPRTGAKQATPVPAVAAPPQPAPVLAAPPRPAAPPVAPEPEPLALAPTPPPAPRIRTQYVGEAPFNNSFPARALSDQPGTYSMFAIESSEEQPEQGTFAVTGNLASHVRDHRSVLEPVCEYVGGYPLGSETRVITEQPGIVHRRGDDWQVTQRAKVRFE